MCHALRHAPHAYGFELDEHGWVSLEGLLVGLRMKGRLLTELTEEQILLVTRSSQKQRFELSDGRIRALYGHSVKKDVKHQARRPPELLYHGTHDKALARIREEGLRSMHRQHVHLATSPSYALSTRTRKKEDPVLFKIQAERAFEQGICFYQANDVVWLAHFVPPQFLSFMTAELLGTKRPWISVIQ